MPVFIEVFSDSLHHHHIVLNVEHIILTLACTAQRYGRHRRIYATVGFTVWIIPPEKQINSFAKGS